MKTRLLLLFLLLHIIVTGQVPSLLHEFKFNNSTSNEANTTNFSLGSGVVFTPDRSNIAANALLIRSNAANGSSANINDIPVGNSNRTISLWYQVTGNLNFPKIFSYGTNSAYRSFAIYIGPNGNIVFNDSYGDLNFGGSYSAGAWRHLVIVYDNNYIYVYVNGVLLNSVYRVLNTNFSAFNMGNTIAFTLIDDLKIYGTALSQTDVTSLYTNNTLSSTDFNQNNLQVALYPNPANDILNIEMTNDVKSIEIYNIQGQKVKTSNQKQINVADLSAGLYMIKVEDTENATATKKFVKQ